MFLIDTITEISRNATTVLELPGITCRSWSKRLALARNNLGYHLKRNLWLGDYDFIHLDDSISADLDVAMSVRREGIEGERTPPGILTHLRHTSVERIIEQIEKAPDPLAIGLGLQMLKLSRTYLKIA